MNRNQNDLFESLSPRKCVSLILDLEVLWGALAALYEYAGKNKSKTTCSALYLFLSLSTRGDMCEADPLVHPSPPFLPPTPLLPPSPSPLPPFPRRGRGPRKLF